METSSNVLIIRHLPVELTLQEREELLQHFGAQCVKCMNDNGKMKCTAFATFPDHEDAASCLKRLHQLEIFGRRLTAEFSTSNNTKNHPSLLDSKKPDASVTEEPCAVASDKETKGVPTEIYQLSPDFALDYPPNPKLQYMYPPPTVNILTNIANALASVPKFYVQVLHLMNKMNLPAPFGPQTATPPIPTGEIFPYSEDVLAEEAMEMSSTEESELESDEGNEKSSKEKSILKLKRPLRKKLTVNKRQKLQKIVSAPRNTSATSLCKPEDVFETSESAPPKKIEFNITNDISKQDDSSKKNGNEVRPSVSHRGLYDEINNEDNTETPSGGFGVLEPLSKSSDIVEDVQVEDDNSTDFISLKELNRNRLSSSEIAAMSVFKKYNAGPRSSRLYIKNVQKQTTEKDLKFIYGRYVNWERDGEVNMFDIRLMKEGRMKGQAFVTLPSEAMAELAVSHTNGYVMNGKPLVVQYARSAKPKEDDSNQQDD